MAKAQISSILKNKIRILELYEAHNALDQKCHKRFPESKYSDLNEALHDWFCVVVPINFYPDGRILREKALKIARHIGCDDFKGSCKWMA